MQYDYYCPANNQIIEVSHSMKDELLTWGELCDYVGMDPGATPRSSEVERIITGGSLAIIKGDRRWRSALSSDCSGDREVCAKINPPCCHGGKCAHR